MITGYKESGGAFPPRPPGPGDDQAAEGTAKQGTRRLWERCPRKDAVQDWGVPALEAGAPASLTAAASEVEHHDPGRRVATPAQNA